VLTLLVIPGFYALLARRSQSPEAGKRALEGLRAG